jgi:hypothetical protein
MKVAHALGAIALICVGAAQAVAQPSPILGTHEMAAQAQSTAALRAEFRANVAQVRANAKASAATREQIQQLRMALKAKLSALRH